MDDDEIWTAIDDQRTRVADLLEGLSPTQLDRPSLCDGWTVRDVAGHLTLQELGLLDGLRGSFHLRSPAYHPFFASRTAIRSSLRVKAVGSACPGNAMLNS